MKAGLEVHQQLATGKLFCACPSDLTDEVRGEFSRRLHATAGESGISDRAALAQTARGLRYRYEISTNSCLVEADEEPPHALNPRALHVALTLAELLKARVVDEIQVMRKMVVDGSNTSGFQRTALIAVDGHLEIGEKSYSILSICLEEDAARKVGEGEGEVHYRLDRLGIPLLEIATGPEIHDGEEAKAVAETLGALLRATREVKRGIGTIREDLNVSVEGGARVEIKGVQELRWIAQFVEHEGERQRHLLQVREQLRERSASVPEGEPADLTEVFRSTASRGVRDAIAKEGRVLGISLLGFAGLLGTAKTGAERLGRELADAARATGAGGILHSDELPAYGITDAEVAATRSALKLGGERDAFVLIAGKRAPGLRALDAVRLRARAALEGVPEETRDPVAEGRTRFSRPLPGRHRMYPETDVPPIPISSALLGQVRLHLPELPDVTLRRLQEKGGLAPDLSVKLVRDGEVGVFDLLTAQGHAPALVARLLTQELPPLELEAGRPIAEEDGPRAQALDPLFRAVEAGTFAKEGLGPVLKGVLVGRLTLDAAIAAAGLGGLTAEGLERTAQEIVAANRPLLRAKGAQAFQPLMGELMAKVRGQRDGKEVAAVLRRLVDDELRALGPPGGPAT